MSKLARDPTAEARLLLTMQFARHGMAPGCCHTAAPRAGSNPPPAHARGLQLLQLASNHCMFAGQQHDAQGAQLPEAPGPGQADLLLTLACSSRVQAGICHPASH